MVGEGAQVVIERSQANNPPSVYVCDPVQPNVVADVVT
jgi:hypothetical protein